MKTPPEKKPNEMTERPGVGLMTLNANEVGRTQTRQAQGEGSARSEETQKRGKRRQTWRLTNATTGWQKSRDLSQRLQFGCLLLSEKHLVLNGFFSSSIPMTFGKASKHSTV